MQWDAVTIWNKNADDAHGERDHEHSRQLSQNIYTNIFNRYINGEQTFPLRQFWTYLRF